MHDCSGGGWFLQSHMRVVPIQIHKKRTACATLRGNEKKMVDLYLKSTMCCSQPPNRLKVDYRAAVSMSKNKIKY